MKKLSDYLLHVSNVAGVPVVRTLDEQLHTPVPHLMCYPNGAVKLVIRSNKAVDWNPTVPLRDQLQLS